MDNYNVKTVSQGCHISYLHKLQYNLYDGLVYVYLMHITLKIINMKFFNNAIYNTYETNTKLMLQCKFFIAKKYLLKQTATVSNMFSSKIKVWSMPMI